jgi:integrase
LLKAIRGTSLHPKEFGSSVVAFSDTALRAIPLLEKGQKTIWDPSLPCFGIRVSRASKTFVLKHRNRWITLGRFPAPLTLSMARSEAKRQLAELTLGKVRPHSITYSQAITLYLEDKAKARRARTVRDYERLLNRLPFKGQLSDITHDEVARQLKKFTAPSEYNHILVALKVFFNWCVKRRYIEHNPTLGLSTHATTSRSRTLSDHEIIAVWKATEEPKIFHSIVRLLFLTGQRVGEIAALQSSWISSSQHSHSGSLPSTFSESDLWTLTIPASVTKNGREHTFPIGPHAASVLKSSMKMAVGHFLFPARGGSGGCFNGWSKSKAALDKSSGVKDWTLHDLRRTYATKMADMGVAPHIIERLLNHVSGQISGVAAVYNRAKYAEEMRQAVDRYEQNLLQLLAKT